MQATITMKQFVLSHATRMAVALSVLIGGAIGITALAISNDVANERTVESARVMPNTHVSTGQGEGLIDAGNARTVAVAPLNAFVSPGQGEGLIDSANRSAVQTTIQAHLGLGQGEGLVGPGGSNDRSILNASDEQVYPRHKQRYQ